MVTETYAIGSIADLISGKTTPGKPKVVQKELNNKSVETTIQEQDKVFKKAVKKQPVQRVTQKKKKMGNKSEIQNQKNTEITSNHKRKLENTDLENEDTGLSKSKQIKLAENRTIFVGNIPLRMSKIKLKDFFSKYGQVEAVRIRGVPVADSRVPKKVASIKKLFHPQRTSAICYVRYSTPEEAQKALVLNGHVLMDHHLRVSLSNENKESDANKSLFIGNVSFSAEEEDIWKLFEPCGDIESVRLVRDGKTGIGKGFGYVNFKSSDSVELALQIEKFTLKGRDLRVSICKTNAKTKKKNDVKLQKNTDKTAVIKKKKKSTASAENEEAVGNAEQNKEKRNEKKSFQGIKISEKKKKKKINKGLLQKKKLAKKLLTKPEK